MKKIVLPLTISFILLNCNQKKSNVSDIDINTEQSTNLKKKLMNKALNDLKSEYDREAHIDSLVILKLFTTKHDESKPIYYEYLVSKYPQINSMYHNAPSLLEDSSGLNHLVVIDRIKRVWIRIQEKHKEDDVLKLVATDN